MAQHDTHAALLHLLAQRSVGKADLDQYQRIAVACSPHLKRTEVCAIYERFGCIAVPGLYVARTYHIIGKPQHDGENGLHVLDTRLYPPGVALSSELGETQAVEYALRTWGKQMIPWEDHYGVVIYEQPPPDSPGSEPYERELMVFSDPPKNGSKRNWKALESSFQEVYEPETINYREIRAACEYNAPLQHLTLCSHAKGAHASDGSCVPASELPPRLQNRISSLRLYWRY